MDLKLINILKSLDENKTGKISIPELQSETYYEDKLTTALLLLPILKYDFGNPQKFNNKNIKKENVIKAFEFIKSNEKEQISYIGIVGDITEVTYEHLKNKIQIESKSLNEKKFFKTQSMTYIPFDKNELTSKKLLSLSSMGFTIFDFGYKSSRVYVNGFEISHSDWGLMPFIEFTRIIGFLHEEYFLGELIYFLSTKEEKLERFIIDNIRSIFVLSLVDLLEDFNFGYYKYMDDLEEYNEFENLINILKCINFNKIRNMKYSFVRDFLYDNRS